FDPCALRAELPATHLALLLPSDESTSELLIVRGPWPTGLSGAQVAFATAVRPILAYLVGALLDANRRERQREQLQALGHDEAEHERPFPAEIVRYFERAHILSGAVLPLVAGGRTLGTLNFSASTPHRLEAAEVESLALLAEQAVLAIQWLQLHGELRDANAA